MIGVRRFCDKIFLCEKNVVNSIIEIRQTRRAALAIRAENVLIARADGDVHARSVGNNVSEHTSYTYDAP